VFEFPAPPHLLAAGPCGSCAFVACDDSSAFLISTPPSAPAILSLSLTLPLLAAIAAVPPSEPPDGSHDFIFAFADGAACRIRLPCIAALKDSDPPNASGLFTFNSIESLQWVTGPPPVDGPVTPPLWKCAPSIDAIITLVVANKSDPPLLIFAAVDAALIVASLSSGECLHTTPLRSQPLILWLPCGGADGRVFGLCDDGLIFCFNFISRAPPEFSPHPLLLPPDGVIAADAAPTPAAVALLVAAASGSVHALKVDHDVILLQGLSAKLSHVTLPRGSGELACAWLRSREVVDVKFVGPRGDVFCLFLDDGDVAVFALLQPDTPLQVVSAFSTPPRAVAAVGSSLLVAGADPFVRVVDVAVLHPPPSKISLPSFIRSYDEALFERGSQDSAALARAALRLFKNQKWRDAADEGSLPPLGGGEGVGAYIRSQSDEILVFSRSSDMSRILLRFDVDGLDRGGGVNLFARVGKAAGIMRSELTAACIFENFLLVGTALGYTMYPPLYFKPLTPPLSVRSTSLRLRSSPSTKTTRSASSSSRPYAFQTRRSSSPPAPTAASSPTPSSLLPPPPSFVTRPFPSRWLRGSCASRI
jgi:hypothetical protein